MMTAILALVGVGLCVFGAADYFGAKTVFQQIEGGIGFGFGTLTLGLAAINDRLGALLNEAKAIRPKETPPAVAPMISSPPSSPELGLGLDRFFSSNGRKEPRL